ncbi:MAG: hypothetical protein KF884_04960 [Fimbriimonadaceae bacterium]|nr:hypothetical protein [Fimbriimonadaceae bacterium]QYK59436.1 MAG: hypothetical protein KF884_04960 [Fimbriimonadaceae bacterium]
MVTTTALLTVLMATLAPRAEPKTFLMFFVKGEGQRPSQEAMEAAMKTHLGNMGEQAKAGFLFAAGPVQDPTGVRRGITVVRAEDRASIPALFTGDDFVKMDLLKIEAAPWEVDLKRFTPGVDPSKITEHRLVLWRSGPESSGSAPEDRQPWLNMLKKSHGLAVWGRVGLSEDPTFKGVIEAAIFVSADSDGLSAALGQDPAHHAFEVLPLWMTLDVVRADR